MIQLPAIAIAVLVIIGYIFFLCGLMIVIGRFGGWIALARRYRLREAFVGKRWYCQHAQLRWSCNYSGCLTVGVNAQGLYLSVWPMFRPGHAKLFIPWAEMVIAMKKSFWLGRHMELQFPNVPGTVIRFHRRLADRFAETIGPQLGA